MTNRLTYDVAPGGLSDSDQEAIFALAEKGLGSNSIALRLKKHPSTVQWFMYRHGLKAPEYRNQQPYWRGGRLVTPFTPAEDAFIEARRQEGLGPSPIARLASERFGTNRNVHTINCRLVMLAAREVA